MDGEEGREKDNNQVSSLATWVKSCPLRKQGTQGRETLASKEEGGMDLCLGYLHFDFV